MAYYVYAFEWIINLKVIGLKTHNIKYIWNSINKFSGEQGMKLNYL